MRFGFWEIILIAVLFLVLFGHAKFPAMMKNLAEGINIFKKEMKTDEKSAASKPAAVAKPAPVKKSPAKKAAKKPVAKKK